MTFELMHVFFSSYLFSLLGDAGYPQYAWLMAPVRYPRSPAQLRYNKALRRTRAVVETTIGLLKARFLCLARPGGELLYSPPKCVRIILACCMLHNICLDRQESWHITEELEPEVRTQHVPTSQTTAAGRVARDQLIERSFTGMYRMT